MKILLPFEALLLAQSATAAPLFESNSGNSIDITYDAASERVKFVGRVNEGSYFAICLGNQIMKDSDMLIF